VTIRSNFLTKSFRAFSKSLQEISEITFHVFPYSLLYSSISVQHYITFPIGALSFDSKQIYCKVEVYPSRSLFLGTPFQISAGRRSAGIEICCEGTEYPDAVRRKGVVLQLWSWAGGADNYSSP